MLYNLVDSCYDEIFMEGIKQRAKNKSLDKRNCYYIYDISFIKEYFNTTSIGVYNYLNANLVDRLFAFEHSSWLYRYSYIAHLY